MDGRIAPTTPACGGARGDCFFGGADEAEAVPLSSSRSKPSSTSPWGGARGGYSRAAEAAAGGGGGGGGGDGGGGHGRGCGGEGGGPEEAAQAADEAADERRRWHRRRRRARKGAEQRRRDEWRRRAWAGHAVALSGLVALIRLYAQPLAAVVPEAPAMCSTISYIRRPRRGCTRIASGRLGRLGRCAEPSTGHPNAEGGGVP